MCAGTLFVAADTPSLPLRTCMLCRKLPHRCFGVEEPRFCSSMSSKLCSSSIWILDPTTTPPATPACDDGTGIDCVHVARFGKCQDYRLKPQCQLACGFCTADTAKPTTGARAPVLFRQQCPVTCNTCTSTSTTSSSTASSSTSTRTTATPTTAAGGHACARIELDPEGQGVGGYKGPVLGNIKHRNSPGGKVWAFNECAEACSNSDYAVAAGFEPTSKVCTYFLLSKSRGCVLKTKRRAFVPNDGRGDVTDHADCGSPKPATEAPLTKPAPATKPSSNTKPQPTTTLLSTKLPATKPPATKLSATTMAVSVPSTTRTNPTTRSNAATTVPMPAQCTAYPHPGNAYAGHIISMFNKAHLDGYVGDPSRCAVLCASNIACAYYSVSTDRNKGCVLKSNRKGRPVSKSTYVGHGECGHVMPATCKLLGTHEGFSRFKSGPWEAIKSIRNAAGCAQKCASTKGCVYWLVHNGNGCFLNDAQKGTLLAARKNFLHHGSCAPPTSTAIPMSTTAATSVCPGGATYNFEPPIPNRQGLAEFHLGSSPPVRSVKTAEACALLCIHDDRCAGFVFGSPTDRGNTAVAATCFLYSDKGVRGKLPTASGVYLYLSRHRLNNQCRSPPTAPPSKATPAP